MSLLRLRMNGKENYFCGAVCGAGAGSCACALPLAVAIAAFKSVTVLPTATLLDQRELFLAM